MPTEPVDAVSEINNARTRKKHLADLERKWNLHFGADYTESCASSHKLQDECRRHFGLSERIIAQEDFTVDKIPEPYRKAGHLELTSDDIGYYKDNFESILFPRNEHAVKRIPFT